MLAKTSYKNFPMVHKVTFGRGCFTQLGDIIAPKRQGKAPMIFFVDSFFQEKPESFVRQLPVESTDEVIFIDVQGHEPSTEQVDQLRDYLQQKHGTVSGIIACGGGAVMDITKAVSLMMNNEGSSVLYQGYDLVKHPGVYKVCVPTLSGTGAEVSRTAVLIGPEKKLGLNSDYTPFDQAVLDPELIRDVPVNQRFFTGMDNYVHCVEALNGTFLNAFSKAYGEKAFDMCTDVFLNKSRWEDTSDDDLMMASWCGGMSIAYSNVGIVHAMGYGLGFALGIRHGVGNCIVFNQLEEFYPEAVGDFKAMVQKWGIELPRGVCAHISEEQLNTCIKVSLGMTLLWENAFGKDWHKIITPEKLAELYLKM